MEKKAKNTVVLINVFIVLFVIALVCILGFYYFDDLKLLATEEGQIAFSQKIQSTGIWGGLIIVLIQVFQVVVAFIPGEFVEIVSGMLFGPYLGLVVSLIGLSFGSMVIWGLVKLFGKSFMELNVNEKNRTKFKFLENETRTLILLFFIFLIPGTPKDFITYLIPFTKVKLIPFIIISSIARIPSIITSTYVGYELVNGGVGNAIIITIITFIIALIGIIFNKPITNKVEILVDKIHKKKYN